MDKKEKEINKLAKILIKSRVAANQNDAVKSAKEMIERSEKRTGILAKEPVPEQIKERLSAEELVKAIIKEKKEIDEFEMLKKKAEKIEKDVEEDEEGAEEETEEE